MSQVINPGDIRAGCIYRISLRNFVTFRKVTLFPGSSLNLIIGPNGTGKSTIVAAIILGLGGNPKAIGREKRLEQFVKSGTSEAKIEIELYQKPKQRNVIITMTFSNKSSSAWYIDNKSVDRKRVLELIESLHIQVENLCQFLPQDKVHEFSAKLPPERLRDTLATVGPPGSVEQLNDLKKLRAEQKEFGNWLHKNQKELQELERRNKTLKRDIQVMKERKEMKKQIEVCEAKMLWLEYLELREKVGEYDRDSKKQARRRTNFEKIITPLKNDLENVKKGVNGLEQKKQAVNTEILVIKEQVTETFDSIRNQAGQIELVQAASQKRKERYESRKQELIVEKSKLDKLNMDKLSFRENLGDENKLQEDLATTQKQISVTTAVSDQCKHQKLNLQYEIDQNIKPQMRQYQRRIGKLEDVDEERLRVIERSKPDTYKALMWLRQNLNQFKEEVHEPMMLKINFSDPKYARYLEATVPARDLVAFTFESTVDMNRFLKIVRSQDMRLVNAVHSKGMPEQSDDIRRLSYLGFKTYLIDTITAPDAILSYLCKQYKIHKIPIGNQHTYDNSDKVPPNITKFFSENHLFSIRFSTYSGAKSSSTREITPANLLAKSIDVEQINSLKIQLAALQETETMNRGSIAEIDKKLNVLENNLRDLNGTREYIESCINKITSNVRNINNQIEKVNDMTKECTFNLQDEIAMCKKKCKDCVIKQCTLHLELDGIMKALQKKILKKELCSAKLNICREAILVRDAQLRERLKEGREIEEVLQRIQNLLDAATASAKQKQIEIKQCCKNKLPNEPEFPNKEMFDALPSEKQAIDTLCCELRTRMGLLGAGDEQMIKEYEQQEKQIKELQTALNNSSNNTRELENKIKKIKTQWLPSLENLIQNINAKFSEMFASLQCAGEVKLVKDGGEDDFDKYGIDVLVKFRAEEQLSRLTNYEQSGGERALTTAVYLMALQALTSDVPFRCVDEINQGMDAENERRMLEMLIEVTTAGKASQYFLLTPKLLPNLRYNEKVTINTVMNGKHIMDYKDWKYEKFLENARRYRPAVKIGEPMHVGVPKSRNRHPAPVDPQQGGQTTPNESLGVA